MPAQPAALRSAQRIVSDDGRAPFPGGGEPPLTAVGRLRAGVTGALVIVLFAGLAAAVSLGVPFTAGWPDPVRLAARRRPPAQDRPQAALPLPGR